MYVLLANILNLDSSLQNFASSRQLEKIHVYKSLILAMLVLRLGSAKLHTNYLLIEMIRQDSQYSMGIPGAGVPLMSANRGRWLFTFFNAPLTPIIFHLKNTAPATSFQCGIQDHYLLRH